MIYVKGLLTDEGFVILKVSKMKEKIPDRISKSFIHYCKREGSSLDIYKRLFMFFSFDGRCSE